MKCFVQRYLKVEAKVGTPRRSTLATAETVAVCEVSSFQAETFRHFRAEATLWTNLAEDHLERHAGMGAYFDAKLRLVLSTSSGRFWAGSSVCL